MYRQTFEQRQLKKRRAKTLGVLAFAAIAIIAYALANVQPIPPAQCQVPTFNGSYGTYNQC